MAHAAAPFADSIAEYHMAAGHIGQHVFFAYQLCRHEAGGLARSFGVHHDRYETLIVDRRLDASTPNV